MIKDDYFRLVLVAARLSLQSLRPLIKDPPPSKNTKSDGITAHLLQEVLKDNKATADGLAKVMEAVKKLSEQQHTHTGDAGQLNLQYLHLLRCIYFSLNVGSDL